MKYFSQENYRYLLEISETNYSVLPYTDRDLTGLINYVLQLYPLPETNSPELYNQNYVPEDQILPTLGIRPDFKVNNVYEFYENFTRFLKIGDDQATVYIYENYSEDSRENFEQEWVNITYLLRQELAIYQTLNKLNRFSFAYLNSSNIYYSYQQRLDALVRITDLYLSYILLEEIRNSLQVFIPDFGVGLFFDTKSYEMIINVGKETLKRNLNYLIAKQGNFPSESYKGLISITSDALAAIQV